LQATIKGPFKLFQIIGMFEIMYEGKKYTNYATFATL
jgi:hypothetical protein